MKVLHIFNGHRGRGGSDIAWAKTMQLSRDRGIEVEAFSRSSKNLSDSLPDKLRAAASGIYAPEAVDAAAEAVKRFAPDLVHTHELYPLISAFVLRRIARMGIPIVHTCYDFRLSCPVATHFHHGEICHRCDNGNEYWAVLNNCRDNRPESMAYALRNAVARKFDLYRENVSRYIVMTEFSHRWLSSTIGIEPSRISIVPVAIESSETPVDSTRGEYIGYAGRMVPEKGVELLVEAARRTGLPVRLACNSATHPAIRPGDPVTCVLTPTREHLVRFYRHARFLVVPSIWYETFGVVAAESMGNGVPVLASRIGALRDTVIEGVTGLFFEMGSVDDLAAKMSLMWSSPDLCRQLGRGGHERVRTEYSDEVHMDCLEATYEDALATRPLRP